MIIFSNLDSVLGPLWMPAMAKQFGRIGVIHQLRKEGYDYAEDWKMLLLAADKSDKRVVATCWDEVRTQEAGKLARVQLKKKDEEVRVYVIGYRVSML